MSPGSVCMLRWGVLAEHSQRPLPPLHPSYSVSPLSLVTCLELFRDRKWTLRPRCAPRSPQPRPEEVPGSAARGTWSGRE